MGKKPVSLHVLALMDLSLNHQEEGDVAVDVVVDEVVVDEEVMEVVMREMKMLMTKKKILMMVIVDVDAGVDVDAEEVDAVEDVKWLFSEILKMLLFYESKPLKLLKVFQAIQKIETNHKFESLRIS